METHKNLPTFYAIDREAWRRWLEENHKSEKSIWLIIYKKESKVPSVYYPEAVNEALCFGWIDSLPNKRDAHSYYQFFSKRNPKSNWSRVNKEKVSLLTEQDLMREAGLEMVEIAKNNGTWNALDEVEILVIPQDLKLLFDENTIAFNNWEKFPKSSKRGILEWILNSKSSETRKKRLYETVSLAEKNLKANHYRQQTP